MINKTKQNLASGEQHQENSTSGEQLNKKEKLTITEDCSEIREEEEDLSSKKPTVTFYAPVLKK